MKRVCAIGLLLLAICCGSATAGPLYTVTDLGTLGGPFSRAWAVNNAGQVVGYSSGVGGTHAFLWQSGTMLDLGALPGDLTSWAGAISGNGWVTGLQDPHEARGFLW